MAACDLALKKAITPLEDHWNTSNPMLYASTKEERKKERKKANICLLLLLRVAQETRGGRVILCPI